MSVIYTSDGKESEISHSETSLCDGDPHVVNSKHLRQRERIQQRPLSAQMPQPKHKPVSRVYSGQGPRRNMDFTNHVHRVLPRNNSLPDITTIAETDSHFWCRKSLCKRYSLRRSQSVEWDPVSALFTATTEDDTKELERILTEFDLDVNFLSPTGVSPLHTAALVGSTGALGVLLEFRAEVELQDGNGHTPLELALHAGNFDCASLLINAGASMGNVVDGIKMY